MKKKILILTIMIACVAMVAVFSGTAMAKVTGVCVNCHTMHNSQGGASMATYGGLGTPPFEALVRGSCLGCHGQTPAGSNNIITNIPQVLHKADDLAAGNFSYIAVTGGKTLTSPATTTTAGHNVYYTAIANETVLTAPPGDENATTITNTNFTCAGTTGCHGDRAVTGDFASVSGAHHAGVGGLCDTATTVANSYRFLKGVKGYENMDATYKYQNCNSRYHNEYFGITTAAEIGGSISAPAGNTISGLCAECHGNFHGVADIGGATTSPFKRHPTDIALPNKTEYSAYTTYSVTAPVARTSLTSINTTGTNDKVTPGTTDVVMCLSCHGAHATAYADILRWDYTGMIAASTSGAPTTGCFICHTTKDNV